MVEFNGRCFFTGKAGIANIGHTTTHASIRAERGGQREGGGGGGGGGGEMEEHKRENEAKERSASRRLDSDMCADMPRCPAAAFTYLTMTLRLSSSSRLQRRNFLFVRGTCTVQLMPRHHWRLPRHYYAATSRPETPSLVSAEEEKYSWFRHYYLQTSITVKTSFTRFLR